MEYFQHGDLHSHVSKGSPVSEPDAQDITYQIIKGLSYMHREGFAHRDLKPKVYISNFVFDSHWLTQREHIRQRMHPGPVVGKVG
jgi:serine/threonine protein kinase